MKARKPETAAFQGERGAFSEQAARQLLGEAVDVRPMPRFEDLFRSLVDKQVDTAVVPIENTLHGSVHENYDHLQHFRVVIVGETRVRIVHNLIAPPGVTIKKIRRVYSHPVALNQCLRFFAEHPEFEKQVFYDTAGSVKMIMEDGLKDAAAIASAGAAGIYGARILKRSIEDDRENYTRFFLLRRPDDPRAVLKPSSKVVWKTSLVFTTRNIPGSLFRCLSAFALRDLNLTKSNPGPLRGKAWEYLFYLDFHGHADDPVTRNALSHLTELAEWRLLGSYPQSPL